MRQSRIEHAEARSAAVAEANKAAEKRRGSGWHAADLGAERREQAGELFLSDRPVVLQDDDRIIIVGTNADRVRAALKNFIVKVEDDQAAIAAINKERREEDEDVREKKSTDFVGMGIKFQDTTVAKAKRALSQSNGFMEMPTADWNYCLAGLMVMNVQVSLASLED